MANAVFSQIQQLSQPSPWVSLYVLDTSKLGGGIYHFTPNIYANGSYLSFGGQSYQPLPMDFTGFEVVTSSQGNNSTQPRPTFVVSNASKTLLSVVISLGDLVGATVKRYRTFEMYLDGQSNANSAEYIGPDIFVIVQKTKHDKNSISWSCAGMIDLPTAKLPARQVLKDPNVLNPTGFPGVQVY